MTPLPHFPFSLPPHPSLAFSCSAWERPPTTTARLYLGDALRVLDSLTPASVDAVITDPPYSSGGMTLTNRSADPSKKYVSHGQKLMRPSFSGDNRDGRSWAY